MSTRIKRVDEDPNEIDVQSCSRTRRTQSNRDRTWRRVSHQTMRPAIGTPINAGASPVAMAVTTSPAAFTTRPTTATHHAQRRSATKPNAVTTIVTESPAMPRMATAPSERSPAWPWGFTLHAKSSALPGHTSVIAAYALAHAPRMNNAARRRIHGSLQLRDMGRCPPHCRFGRPLI